MKNQYLKLMIVLLITFPSLLGCRGVKKLPKVVDGVSDFAKRVRIWINPPKPPVKRRQFSQLKKLVKEAASLNITEEAINNGNKISKQKVEKHITDEMSRQIKKMNLKRKLSTAETEEKEEIEKQVEEDVEKDLEKKGITVTAN